MPLIKFSSTIGRPWYLFNAHLETIVPFLGDEIEPDLYQRERIELQDGDFLDLDWINNNSKHLIIISHGLEGNSQSYYVKRAAKYFSALGWDILTWNFRSCGKEMNRTPRFYHFGETEDLSSVVKHATTSGRYDKTVLIGYSIGGSMTLKYLGTTEPHASIKGAIAFSVPCQYLESRDLLERRSNRLYRNKILKKLNAKLQRKAMEFDELKFEKELESVREFDEQVIVPTFGFDSPDDLYHQSSCLHFLEGIKVPAFLGNALNDPLLGERCYPYEVAKNHPFIYLETPRHGGHVGFTSRNNGNWMDQRAEKFIYDFIEREAE